AREGGHIDLRAQHGLGRGDGHLHLEVASVASEVRVWLHSDDDGQVAAGPAGLAGFALTAEPKLGAGLDARRNLDDERLAVVVAADVDRGLAPPHGGQERDAERRLHVPARTRTGLASTAAHPAQDLLEDAAAGVRALGRTRTGPGPRRRPGAPGMPE